MDIGIRLTTAFYGADENGNGVPDECDDGPPCDLDFDGDVDYDGYVIFLDVFGGPVDGNPPQDGLCDYDQTGAVGMADYGAWLACYRDFAGDPLAGAPVPPGPGTTELEVNLNADRSRRTGATTATLDTGDPQQQAVEPQSHMGSPSRR